MPATPAQAAARRAPGPQLRGARPAGSITPHDPSPPAAANLHAGSSARRAGHAWPQLGAPALCCHHEAAQLTTPRGRPHLVDERGGAGHQFDVVAGQDELILDGGRALALDARQHLHHPHNLLAQEVADLHLGAAVCRGGHRGGAGAGCFVWVGASMPRRAELQRRPARDSCVRGAARATLQAGRASRESGAGPRQGGRPARAARRRVAAAASAARGAHSQC